MGGRESQHLIVPWKRGNQPEEPQGGGWSSRKHLHASTVLPGSKPRPPCTPKANRIAIHHELGRVVAMIEVVSPGNKDIKHAVASFIAKAVDFIRNGIHFLVMAEIQRGRESISGAQSTPGLLSALTSDPLTAAST